MKPASGPGSAQALQLIALLPAAAPVPAGAPARPPLPPLPAVAPAPPLLPPLPALAPARPPLPPRPAEEEPAPPRPAAEEPPRPAAAGRPASAPEPAPLSSIAPSRSRSPVPARSCDFVHPASNSSALAAPKAKLIVRSTRELTEVILDDPLCESDEQSSAWDPLIDELQAPCIPVYSETNEGAGKRARQVGAVSGRRCGQNSER